MPHSQTCPKCQSTLSAADLGGLCPRCLAGTAFGLLSPRSPEDEEHAPEGGDEPSPGTAPHFFGEYELLGEIARGGMGVVYKARQISLNRIVALKLILGGQLAGPEEVRRFRSEAEAAASLKHPNIVAIHEVGDQDGQHFFSMDFIEGRSLAAAAREQPLPAEQAARCVRTIAEAVHYAHQHGVLHRDLKPANVLLDADDQPHVTDFGLARRITGDSELTQTGQVLGTPGYMSPEQASARNEALGPGTDVYSLGAVLYDLLTGRPPFAAATPHETLHQVLTVEPVAPRLLNPAVPRDLETICLKCLEKEPARRYGTAQALAADLGRYLNQEPIQALPPSTIYRARKFVRRHRLGVAVAASFAVVLLVATVVSITYSWRAERERKEAIQARAQESDQRSIAMDAGAKAREQAQRATQSAAEATAVLDFFLNKVLIAASPLGEEGGLGRDATIREAVAAAEHSIKESFSAQPLVEAQIRAVLGDTYHKLGNNPAALEQHQQAYNLLRTNRGEHHEHTLAVASNLALDLAALGRLVDSIRGFEELLALHQKYFGESSIHTIRTMNNLAESYLSAHRYDQAIVLLEKARALALQHPPTDTDPDRILAAILNNLGTGFISLHRFKEAAEAFEAALKAIANKEGLNIELTLRSNLAHVWKALGRIEDARRFTEKFAGETEARLGADHPRSLLAHNLLATYYNDQGEFTKAVDLFEKNLAAYQAKLGPHHYETLVAMNNLAMAYRDAGRTNEALEYLERTLALRQEHLAADNPDILYSMISLAAVYREFGRARDGVELLEKARVRATNSLPRSHPANLHVLNSLAVAYDSVGRSDEAIPIHEETLRARQAAFGPDDQTSLDSLWNLASAYHKEHRPDEAHRCLKELLAAQTRRLGATNERVALATACIDTGFFLEAANVIRGNMVPSVKLSRKDALAMGQAYIQLGETLLGQAKFTEAEPFLRKALAGFQESQHGLTPEFTAQSLLGAAMLGQGNYPEATNLLMQAYQGLTERQGGSPSAARARVLSNTVQHLVQLYDAWSKPEQAAEWRAKASAAKAATRE